MSTDMKAHIEDAFLRHDHQLVRELCDHKVIGPDVLNQRSWVGYAPLHMAVLRGLPDLVRAILGAGADVDFQTDHGNTALHLAAQTSKPSCAALLLRAGASIDLRTESGKLAQDLGLADMIEAARADRAIAKAISQAKDLKRAAGVGL